MDHIDPVSLARLQFAMTALYHFLFVPLTLGLSFLLAIMESAYVMTGRQIWCPRDHGCARRQAHRSRGDGDLSVFCQSTRSCRCEAPLIIIREPSPLSAV